MPISKIYNVPVLLSRLVRITDLATSLLWYYRTVDDLATKVPLLSLDGYHERRPDPQFLSPSDRHLASPVRGILRFVSSDLADVTTPFSFPNSAPGKIDH